MFKTAIARLKRLLMPGTFRALAEYRTETDKLLQDLRNLNQAYNDTVADLGALQISSALALNAVCKSLVIHSSPESYFECELNGAQVLLPRDTLRTMAHCIHTSVDKPLTLAVEVAHSNWLKEKLRPGDVFLDVGAATGAMTLPFAKTLPDVRIVAFEPNRTTRRILRDTLAKNNITGIELLDFAVSDFVGTTTFIELPYDPTGAMPWWPESSSLITESLANYSVGEKFEAPVTTLDAFFGNRSDTSSVRSIKIDVEGFETHVLRGAANFLATARPFIAIDIHNNPFGDGTTETGVRDILSPLRFTFDKFGHVLLCSPPQA